MEPNEIDKMYQLEESHWWFQGKKLLINTALGMAGVPQGNFLDIGCGTGMFLREIGKGKPAFGLDVSERALAYCREKGSEFLVQSSGGTLPFKDESFSLVSLLDMLEHIDDDRKVLQEVYRICKPGAVVLVTVPAFNFLWGSHDVVHHHKRRYTRPGLRAIADSTGFCLERLTYTNFFIFLPVLVNRTISRSADSGDSDLKETSGIISSVLRWLYRLEALYLKRANFPFGVSLLMVLRKPGVTAL